MHSSLSPSPIKPIYFTANTDNKNIEKHQLQNILSLKLFLKVYINLILFYNNIYPENCFTNKLNSEQIFNLSIHLPVIRHPYLVEYIENVIDSFVNDVLLINFTQLLKNNDDIILLNDDEEEEEEDDDEENINNNSVTFNDLKFILELIEIQEDLSDGIVKEIVTNRFILDFVNFPIDYYQNINNSNIISCFRENLISLNTFLQLNNKKNEDCEYLSDGKLKNDRYFKIKINLPSHFQLSETSQFDWFYKNNEQATNYKQKVPLKEMEFTDNVTIYSSFEKY